MQDPINLDQWYTADDARQRLGVSTKTLNVYAREGANIEGQNYRIRKAERPVPGRRAMSVYCPEDVDKIADLRPKQASAVPALAASPAPLGVAGPATAMVMIAEAIEAAKPPASVFLSIEQAAKLAGLSKDMIGRLARAGKIRGVMRGRWLLFRASVEALTPEDIEGLPRDPKKG